MKRRRTNERYVGRGRVERVMGRRRRGKKERKRKNGMWVSGEEKSKKSSKRVGRRKRS